jgi:hypothetical protein
MVSACVRIFSAAERMDSNRLSSWTNGCSTFWRAPRSLAGAFVLLQVASLRRRIVAKLDALMAKRRRAKEALDAIPPLLDKLRQSMHSSIVILVRCGST